MICPGINNRYKRNPLSLNANSNFLSGALFICRRSLFKKLSFDPNQYPADDVSFIDKAKELGFKVGYDPEIFIYHRGRKDIKGYLKQLYFFGNSRLRKEGIGRILKRPLFFIPAIFTLYLILLVSFISITITSGIWRNFLISSTIPLIAYILFDLIASLKISIQNAEARALFLTPVLILLTHISYGLGILSGIISNKQREGI